MNKTLIALAALVIIPTAAIAGFGHHGGDRGGPNIERMARILDLTTEQQEQLKTLRAEQTKKRDEMRAAMQTEMQAKMQTILTKEQFAKMADLRDMRFNKGDRPMGGRGMGPGMGAGCDGMGPRNK